MRYIASFAKYSVALTVPDYPHAKLTTHTNILSNLPSVITPWQSQHALIFYTAAHYINLSHPHSTIDQNMLNTKNPLHAMLPRFLWPPDILQTNRLTDIIRTPYLPTSWQIARQNPTCLLLYKPQALVIIINNSIIFTIGACTIPIP